MSSRYFYYIIILEYINGIISIIPSFLFESTDKGAILSILLAIAAGYIFLLVTTTFLKSYPGRGLPELLQDCLPKWMTTPLLLMLSLVWFLISLKTLFNYSLLLKQFLTPNLQIIGIVITFLSFITYSFFMKSKKLLYTLEMVLLISIPLIVYIVAILYSNEGIDWDYIMKAMMHAKQIPNYFAFSSAFFLFLGVANLNVFNREFKSKLKINNFYLHLLVLLAAAFLFTIYFIPIGYNGFEQIKYINFPWLLATDSVKVAIVFLERMMYVLLFLNLLIAFASIIISWHVSMEFFKSAAKGFSAKSKKIITYIFVLLVWGISLLLSVRISETNYLLYSKYLLCSIPLIFLMMMVLYGFISWRKKNEKYSNT